MILQNSGGLIMENALEKFERIAALQPLINGKFEIKIMCNSSMINLMILFLYLLFSKELVEV